jgi:hypothetical protein
MDLGDLPNLLAAELGVMTVRIERAVRSLEGVGRVQVNRWGDGSAHLHLWFLARPFGQLQLRGTFLSLWDDILPAVPEARWRENLALIGAWLAEFGGRSLIEPPHIEWKASLSFELIERDARAAAVASTRTAMESGVSAEESDPGAVTQRIEPSQDELPEASPQGEHETAALGVPTVATDTTDPSGPAGITAADASTNGALEDSPHGVLEDPAPGALASAQDADDRGTQTNGSEAAVPGVSFGEAGLGAAAPTALAEPPSAVVGAADGSSSPAGLDGQAVDGVPSEVPVGRKTPAPRKSASTRRVSNAAPRAGDSEGAVAVASGPESATDPEGAAPKTPKPRTPRAPRKTAKKAAPPAAAVD